MRTDTKGEGVEIRGKHKGMVRAFRGLFKEMGVDGWREGHEQTLHQR